MNTITMINETRYENKVSGTLFTRIKDVFLTYIKNLKTRNELAGMSDRELSDIGISRCDISRIFNSRDLGIAQNI